MLSGPSTSFSYASLRRKRRSPRYGSPAVLVCHTCRVYIVMLTAPKTGNRIPIDLQTFAASPSLVYSFKKHGYGHYHPYDPPLSIPEK